MSTKPPFDRDLLTCPTTYQACLTRPLLQRATVYQSAVVDLQCMLNRKNSAGLTVDGYFGSLTETAVQNWQSKNYLTVDGIVGPQTWTSL
jgi:peptidoglycan hydrolase-like protein with peptidoglycan-binding domain